jgi:hypothetical protein
VAFPGQWRKFLPTDLQSPWWYNADELARLIYARIGEVAPGGDDPLAGTRFSVPKVERPVYGLRSLLEARHALPGSCTYTDAINSAVAIHLVMPV